MRAFRGDLARWIGVDETQMWDLMGLWGTLCCDEVLDDWPDDDDADDDDDE